ncbi:hypothetical protein LIER_17952 [Lithospermum erythrorhizon]|uniref:Uncharacterized protein n=1 Tax=Lithospermum erythrorhizon TaxID=34254 RepID=A0AAV3QEU5_LITER
MSVTVHLVLKCNFLFHSARADQVEDLRDLPTYTTPVPSSRCKRQRFSPAVPKRTISTRLTHIVESPIVTKSPVIESHVEYCDNLADYNYQVAPSVRIEKIYLNNKSISGNNVQNNNETRIRSLNNPPDEQNSRQYLSDIEAKILRRANERWEREREKTIQSSRYTHYSKDRAVSESSDTPRPQNYPHERRPTAPALPIGLPATQSDDAIQKLLEELQDRKEIIKELIPTAASRRECKTKISFTDRLDVVPLSKGFMLPQFTQFGGSGDHIKHLQGFLAKMTITSTNPNI